MLGKERKTIKSKELLEKKKQTRKSKKEEKKIREEFWVEWYRSLWAILLLAQAGQAQSSPTHSEIADDIPIQF